MNDFNNLDKWLPPKIKALGLTFEKFGRKAKVSRASVYNYVKDANRPDSQSMVRMCHVLGVSLDEGLRQYTPKKVGRPSIGMMAKKKRTIR